MADGRAVRRRRTGRRRRIGARSAIRSSHDEEKEKEAVDNFSSPIALPKTQITSKIKKYKAQSNSLIVNSIGESIAAQ